MHEVDIQKLGVQNARRVEGAFMGACRHAESFLRTWRQQLPFGRRLAP